MEGTHRIFFAALLHWSSQRKIQIGDCIYHVERLHKIPSLMDECCDLINMEWKRSHVARIRSIGSSAEDFPMSLVLLRNKEKPRVVGHCKLSKLGFSDAKVFVETVVVHPDLRGKGLGRFLMEEVENVCRSKNIKWIYLSTEDKKLFYEKLGYTKCPPVNIYGFQPNDPTENTTKFEENTNPKLDSVNKSNSTSGVNIPPPPPPPLPKTVKALPYSSSNKTYMRKEIIF